MSVEVRRRLSGVTASVLPWVLILGLLAGLLPFATASLVGGIVALVVSGGLILLALLGIEGTALLLLALGIATSPMDRLKPVPALDFVALSDYFLVAGIGLLVLVVLSHRARPEPLLWLGVSGVTIVGFVSSLLSDDSGASLNSLLRLVVGAMILPLIFTVYGAKDWVAPAFAGAYLLGSAVNVGLAMVGDVSIEGRRIGESSHPNVLGLCCLLAVALLPYVWESLDRRWHWLVIACAGANAWGIWTSGSRAALIAAVGALALYILFTRSVVVALAAFGAAIPALYYAGISIGRQGVGEQNALTRLLGGGSASASDAAREQLVQEALDVFQAHPIFGAGLAQVLEAHNIYLQIMAAIGIVGLAFYLVLLLAVVHRAMTLPGHGWLLVLPPLTYVMVGFMTTILWDRYIWAVLALPFLAAVTRRSDDDGDGTDPDDDAAWYGTAESWPAAHPVARGGSSPGPPLLAPMPALALRPTDQEPSP